MKSGSVLFIGFVSVLVVVALIASFIIPFVTKESISFTVTDKDRITVSDGDSTSSKYLIWADRSDGVSEVFENVDTWAYWKFNSSDVQGVLKIGSECAATVYGYRIPFLSMYRNIVSAVCSP